MNIKPVLKDNDWSTIIDIANKGQAQNYWNIGDEIDLVLKGTLFNETVTLQIWDFNHFDKSDGTGKANICFGMKHLMYGEYCMNWSNNMNTWNDSYMRNITMNNVFNSIPIEIKNHIKEVNTYANAGYSGMEESQGLLCMDKVFIPGLSEIDNECENQNKTEQGQSIISIFKDKNNIIKNMNNGFDITGHWWTRSHYYYKNNFFCYFDYDGDWGGSNADYRFGVCFCFNI